MPLTCRAASQTSCWSCTKRRVKCDSKKPSCGRCAQDGLICPGYVKPLQWIGRPSRPRNIRQSTDVVLVLDPAKSLDTNTTLKFLAQVVEAFNSQILPQAVPAKQPFTRHTSQVVVTPALPTVLQHLLIVALHTAIIHRQGRIALDNEDLCRHRGLALQRLGQLVTTAEQTGMLLLTIVMAMVADFGLCYYAAWKYHLEAARKLILSQGGLTACLQSISVTAHVIENGLLTLDVLSATVMPTDALTPAMIGIQNEYLTLLPSLEERLILKTDTCPQMILQCIIHINVLRTSCEPGWKARFANIRHKIECFDHTAWAEKVSHYGLSRPLRVGDEPCEQSIEAWSLVARCYSTATLIYLLINAAPRSTFQKELILMIGRLWSCVRSISERAVADTDADVSRQLWKYVNWPIFMLVKCAAEIGYDKNMQNSAVSLLERVAYTTGVRSWLGLVDTFACREH